MKVDDKLLKKSLNAAIDHSVIKKEGFKDKVRKFDESIDFIINLKDINLNDPKQRIDKEILLPNKIMNSDRPNVCVIASDEILLEAKKLGLDTIDNDGLVKLNNEEKKVKKKFVKKYDFFIVEDKMMPNVARYLARFLGPLGKMPKPFPSGYGIISNPNDLRNIPGGIWYAIRAASISKVPEPNIGSVKFELPSQPVSLIIPAASTSLRGAWPPDIL